MSRVVLIALLIAGIAQDAALTDSLDGRIVNGNDVTIAKHPYQVSVRYRTCDACAYIHDCGGAIYNEDTVICAAHCLYHREPHDYVVVAGTDNRVGSDGVVTRVAKIVIHENYNASITDNDVALLFLATPLTLNQATVNGVALATETPAIGAKSVVVGWGATTEGGMYAQKLQEAEVAIISKEACQESYSGGRPITEGMLCARVEGGGKDACSGDSGGPLLVKKQLAGIVSWGMGCARPDSPGVYADVAYYGEWLRQTIAENSLFV